MTKTNPHPTALESATGLTLTTISGQKVDLASPQEEQLNIYDIANSLSHICIMGGDVSRFFSEAQHSLLTCALAPAHLKREALLMGAYKAFFGSASNSLKALLDVHLEPMIWNFETVLFQKFGLDPLNLVSVQEFSDVAADLEDEALRKGQPDRYLETLASFNMIIDGSEAYYRPIVARLEFLRVFHDLFAKEGQDGI